MIGEGLDDDDETPQQKKRKKKIDLVIPYKSPFLMNFARNLHTIAAQKHPNDRYKKRPSYLGALPGAETDRPQANAHSGTKVNRGFYGSRWNQAATKHFGEPNINVHKYILPISIYDNIFVNS